MKRFRQLISYLLLFVLNMQVFGNTVVDPNAHQNTNVTHSQNGVEVININTPTDRGVSVNTFQEYNVDQNGQIINNATGVGRSHLGGLVNPNNNLAPGQEARTVIFQVNGSNRSNIEGYIEALSPHGINLFIANENGIYANRAGFINIDRAVLTTGRLNLRGDGSVDTISVRNGVITIGPAGFDASRTNYMAMISRTQELHGKIVAGGELTSVTGTNDVSMNDIETQLVNAVTVSGAKPELAIDGSAFGAMYAGQIKIMATELGVGVKSDAVIYAENGGIEILANGDVVVNKLQGNNINVVGTNYEQTGVAYTQGNMNISALTSKILGEGTQVIGNLNFTGSLDNRADMQTNGKLTIGSNLNNIANISSVGNMDIFGNIVNTTGNISTEGFLLSRGNVTNNSGKIVVEGSFIAQGDLQNDSGMIYSEKDINVRNISNNGVIQSLENLQAGNIINNNKIVSLGNLTGGNVINTSTIQSVGAIKVLNVDNSGTLLSESNIETHNLINRDTFISNGVLTTLNLTNETGAQLQSVSNISTNSLVNRGDIATNGSLLATNGFENYGTIGTQGTLAANGTNILNTGTIESGRITLTGASVSNTGSLVGIENIILNTGYLQNTNSLLTNGNIEVTGNVLNQGTMEVGNDLRTRSLDNQGNITVTNNTTVLGDFLNTGRLLSAETLDIRGTSFVNNNEVLATNVYVDSLNAINNGEITGSDVVSLKGLTNNAGSIIGHNLTLDTTNLINTNKILSTNNISILNATINNTGEIRSNNDLNLNNGSLTNGGTLESHRVYLNNGIVNNTGNIRSNETLDLNSTILTNSGTLESHNILLNNSVVNNINTIRSNQLLDMNNTWLSNSGTLESYQIKMLNLSNYTNTGRITGDFVELQVGYDLNLTGLLHANELLKITANDVTLISGTTGAEKIEVIGNNITNNQEELAAEIIVMTATGTLTNNEMITGNVGVLSGYNVINNNLISFGDTLHIIAGNDVINTSGQVIYAQNYLDINATNNILNDKGASILSQGLIKLNGNNITNNVAEINTTGDILITSNSFSNIGEVSGLDDYELYWETWDGRTLTQAEVDTIWKIIPNSDGKKGADLGAVIKEAIGISSTREYDFWFINYFKKEMEQMYPGVGYENYTQAQIEAYFHQYTTGDGGFIRTSSAQYEDVALREKVKSNSVTNQGKVLAGGNITITSADVTNQDSMISGGQAVTINATTLRNQSSTGLLVPVRYGVEFYKQEEYGSEPYHVKFWRELRTGNFEYVKGIGSTIEGGVLTLGGLIGNGENSTTISSPATSQTKDVLTGGSQGLTLILGTTGVSGAGIGNGNVSITRNTSPIQNVINSGTISPNVSNPNLNAMFAASKNPNSNYLMETRSQYIDISAFYGSDYFLSRIGFDESKDWSKAKRLGDAYYEHLLLTRTIQDTLGTRFINGKSDQELIKTMLDNSVSVSEDLNLSVGVKLTKEQVAALKEDIIWYAYEIVNGEQVLVPQVYLSQATLSTIEVDVRDKIGGQEGTYITADEIRNTGQKIGNKGTTQIIAGTIVNETKTNELAEIKGNKTIVIATTGNIENIGGKISGVESVSVVAKKGDVINSASLTKTSDGFGSNKTESDRIVSIGEITSEGETYISGVNYTSKGGTVEGKDVTIVAENNVNIESVELKGTDRSGDGGKNNRVYSQTVNAGSEVIGSDSVTIVAGNDVNVKGSFVASEGKVAIVAENNVNIENTKNTMEETKTSSSKSTFKKSSKESRDYVESASASTIVGGDIVIDAGNDVNIRSSNLVAIKAGEDDGNEYKDMSNKDESKLKNGQQNISNNSSPKPKKAPSGSGNIQISAKNNINITAEELKEEHYSKEKSSGFSTSFSTKGGSATAGVSYSKNSKEVDINKTNISVSSISSEGSTILDAGNRIRTEAMQANIGEDFIVMGKNGIDMLDAQEVYSERISEKSSSIGVSVSVGTTVTQLASTIGNVSDNVKGYGLSNPSQAINTLGNGFQDLRDVAGVTQNLRNWYGQKGYIATKGLLNGETENPLTKQSNIKNALTGMVTASVTASYNKSSSESNTNGTTSVAGNINVGGNMMLISDGDVRLVNQKITVGENLIVEANNFEVLAGQNTHNTSSSSKSVGANVGYNLVNGTMTGGGSFNKGNNKGNGISYDNSTINVGEVFQLTTKGNATFKGVNVTADKFDFVIGGSMLVESLQDEYKSSGKNVGINVSVSSKLPGTQHESMNATPSMGGSFSKNNQDSKWVNNQTSLIANNGGSVKVEGTLTNKGAILGSLSDENKLSVSASKVVIEDIKDYDKGKEQGINVSGIGAKTPIGQTGVQYGSHDKQQDTNTTFVNTTVVENGQVINIGERANTDLSLAQVITKDEKVEKIDVMLHTDLANKEIRDQVSKDIQGLLNTPGDILDAIKATGEGSNFFDNLVGTIRASNSEVTNKQQMKDKYDKFNKDTTMSPEEKAEAALKLAIDSANGLRGEFGIGNDVPIVVMMADNSKGEEFAAFVREDGALTIFLDPSKIDMSNSFEVFNGLMYELNHYNPSNPYVYNKREDQVEKYTNIHNLEESFTDLGRYEVDGRKNNFYENIIKGSSVISYGNSLYDTFDEKQLDFGLQTGDAKIDKDLIHYDFRYQKPNIIYKEVKRLEKREKTKKTVTNQFNKKKTNVNSTENAKARDAAIKKAQAQTQEQFEKDEIEINFLVKQYEKDFPTQAKKETDQQKYEKMEAYYNYENRLGEFDSKDRNKDDFTIVSTTGQKYNGLDEYWYTGNEDENVKLKALGDINNAISIALDRKGLTKEQKKNLQERQTEINKEMGAISAQKRSSLGELGGTGSAYLTFATALDYDSYNKKIYVDSQAMAKEAEKTQGLSALGMGAALGNLETAGKIDFNSMLNSNSTGKSAIQKEIDSMKGYNVNDSDAVKTQINSTTNNNQQLALPVPEKQLALPAPTDNSKIWTSTKNKTGVENVYGHWEKHKNEFPEINNALDYANKTKTFLNSPPNKSLMKTRLNGDIVIYDPVTGTFGVKDINGTPRTMFKPDPNQHNYPTNIDYFLAQ